MTNTMIDRYHNLINQEALTKEEKRELETLKKLAHQEGLHTAIRQLERLEEVNILSYENVAGLYRVQTYINDKLKTVARVKIAKKDAYILIRETTARELNKDYEIINYNLPAGYHVDGATDLYNDLKAIVEYHVETQTL